ncbi:MAG: hypothetical protein K1V88_08645, partial [Muribaculaceae bacterium]
MGRMRLVHSFNTRPLSIDCYGVDSLRRMAGNIWYYALSVAYAKAAGAEIELHADSLGAALLGHLPYDSVHLTLDSMPRELHPRFWAAGKMWAIEAAGPGAVHIDGDVFIKRRSLLDDIAGSRWDFIAQHYESSEWYEKENVLFDRHPRVCASRGLDTHRPGAYNTGAIGFRDPALMESYLAAYKGMALELSGLARGLLDGGRDLTPDVIIEQRHAFQLCRRAGARVKLMLPGDTGHGQTATRIGYQHVVTSRKFELLDKCRAALLA